MLSIRFFRVGLIIVLLFIMNICYAGTTVFRLNPIVPAPSQVLPGNTAIAIYTVTNNSPVTLNGSGVVNLPPGVNQVTGSGLCNRTFNLAPNSSCQLKLTFTADQIQGTASGGPEVCNTPSHPVYCSIPETANQFYVTVGNSPEAIATISVPATLTLNAGTTTNLTVTNTSATVIANAITATAASNLAAELVSINSSGCDTLAPNSTCNIVITTKSDASVVTGTITVSGSNTNTVTTSATVSLGEIDIALNTTPSSIHLQYRQIILNNTSYINKTYNGTTVSAPILNKIHVCGTNDADCDTDFQSTCTDGQTLAGQASCYLWIKSLDGSLQDTESGTLTVSTSSNDKVFNADYAMHLYAGGDFTAAGGVSTNNIAKWDGTNWTSVGSGAENGTDDSVWSLIVFNGDLYVGGKFSNAGTTMTGSLAQWNGNSWGILGGEIIRGPYDGVRALAIFNNDLYAGGRWISVDGNADILALTAWNGTNWTTVGDLDFTSNTAVFALTPLTGSLYVGGLFTIDDKENIAEWDGTTWSALNTGLDSSVISLTSLAGNLYAGGTFTNIAGYVARWTGTVWAPLGSGMADLVHAVTSFNGILYAGGVTPLGTDVPMIAAWDGNNWTTIGTSTASWAFSLLGYENTLYAGGTFTQINGSPLAHIAAWDGASWNNLGTGITTGSFVWALFPAASLAMSE